MGRASYPTRTVKRRAVRPGDVVLIRRPEVPNPRWLLVNWVNPVDPGVVWSGRWAFGADAGTWTTQRVADQRYTAKDGRDARRDAERVNALPRRLPV